MGEIFSTCGHKAKKENPHYQLLYEDSWLERTIPMEYVKGEISAVICEKCLPDYYEWYKVLSCGFLWD